jgi:hypothetical protein
MLLFFVFTIVAVEERSLLHGGQEDFEFKAEFGA